MFLSFKLFCAKLYFSLMPSKAFTANKTKCGTPPPKSHTGYKFTSYKYKLQSASKCTLFTISFFMHFELKRQVDKSGKVRGRVAGGEMFVLLGGMLWRFLGVIV